MLSNRYVKNWLDDSEFSHLNGKGWKQFAWEFLRRNEEYQHAQLAWREKAEESCGSGFFPTEGPIAEMALAINERFGIIARSSESVDKFCVQHPGIDSPPTFGQCRVYLANSKLPDTVPDKTIFVEFDLTLPIEFQLNRIKKSLEKYEDILQVQMLDLFGKTTDRPIMKKRFNKRNKQLLIQYLRILDAIALGATNSEIIKAMYNDIPNDYPERVASARVRDHKEAALFFKNGGYRDLVLLL